MAAKRARVGFLGVGWIGRHRMEAMLATDAIEAVAIADPSPDMVADALKLAPEARSVDGLAGLLACDLDGVVIATPSALHAEQSIAALNAGVAVFCQKPLGRTAAEVDAVIEAARQNNRLLAVDLSYRFAEGMRAIRALGQGGELGRIFAADLVFHNAYGPDKAWFYDKALSGGGCVIDLGVHLVDLALWVLDFPEVVAVQSQLFAAGEPIGPASQTVEDYAVAALTLATGAAVRVACSWRVHAGVDAEIAAVFYGTQGGAAWRNIAGSFYDFAAERFRGTSRESLASPPDAWGGRAAADWAQKLAGGARFDGDATHLADGARVLDAIYGP